MAKRKTQSARPVKRVLARQEVARAGRAAAPARAPSAARSSGSSYTLDIVALALFIAAVGTLAALLSYHREDATATRLANLIGPVGHALSFKLFGTLGVCAYLVPIAMAYSSVALFVRGRAKRRGRQIAGVLILALAGAVLAHLLVGSTSVLSYPPGGAVGAALGESLRALFSTFGSVLVTFAIAAAGLVLATDSAFARLCVALGRLTRDGAVAAWRLGLAEGRKGLATYKLRRAQRLQERAEEEAAFAQALADAEELEGERMYALARGEDEADESPDVGADTERPPSEEELIASEADAIAEEAARISREAQAKLEQLEAEAAAREAAARAARRVRAAPAGDPAWALSMPPPPAEPSPEPPAAPQPVKEPAAAKPLLTLPLRTSVPPSPRASLPPQPAPVSLPPPPVPKDAPPEPAVAVGPVLPLIVEPKAPARARPVKDEKKDPFAFEGASSFSLPPLDLLEDRESQRQVIDKEAYFSTADKLREKLASFGIAGTVKEIRPGPVVTMYEFEPAPGIKISKIASLADDLAMAMEALKVRIVAPIPGKGVVGIEVPNKQRETVYLREIVEQELFLKSPSKLAMAIGKNIEGLPYVTDLAKMPHLLIAGTTGSGKSVSVNTMIMSILFKATPEEVRLIMVDPKVTELSIYEGIPHLLLPVVTDARKAALALRWAVEEMERRYQLLADAGVRNIGGYNKWVERMQAEVPVPAAPKADKPPVPAKLRIIDVAEGESEEEAIARVSSDGPTLGVPAPTDNAPESPKVFAQPEDGSLAECTDQSVEPQACDEDAPLPEERVQADGPKKLPYIVIIIDEVADLMMVASREVETYVARLAQMARAAGIHLMIATQRPSTDVITGVIKANFPSRVSFQLRSKPDSMTILGCVGAEALLGMGDMLILPPTSAHLERVHGAFVSDGEITKVVSHLKAQGKPVYDESILKPRDEESEEGGGGTEEHADEMYDQCLAIVSEMHTVSVSMLQRKLRLGYNRAARIIERMEREGIVGPANGSKPREVLIRPVGEMHREVNL